MSFQDRIGTLERGASTDAGAAPDSSAACDAGASLGHDGGATLSLAGRRLVLLPQRAGWLPDSRTLLVADVHLGKDASFRALGVPVPDGSVAVSLARLTTLVDALAPAAVVVLGDLLHGPAAQQGGTVPALACWRARHAAVRVVLVRGNHDDRAGDPPAACGIAVVDDGLEVDGWVLRHAPADDPRGYVIAGHLHPAWRLHGRVDRLRLPCFWVRERYAVLPAFGEFTGGWTVPAGPGDRVFVSDGARVHLVPPRR